ncbi:MAG TPA: AbrB/MazE/SpoVT family DNA-binding domain-containing protein [Thermoplasmata archaeon]|nr:AbrB/MazE/SpoVT family DNA-binding domain-containing protein [Thermoplasmata archaeon]
MVDVATVTSKGQVTLPASIRKRLGLRKGSKLIFLEEEQGIRLVAGEDLEKRFALFERMAADTNLSPKRLSALVKEAKDRLWREHYASRD